jgi:hypothetical protein
LRNPLQVEYDRGVVAQNCFRCPEGREGAKTNQPRAERRGRGAPPWVKVKQHIYRSPEGQRCEAFSNVNIVFVQPLTAMVDPIRDMFA